jgi:hypothetical protein
MSKEAMKLALEALDGEHVDRAYGYIQEALVNGEEHMNDAKDRLIRIMGTFDLATGHADTMDQVLDALEDELSDVIGHLRARREWVGLTEGEVDKIIDAEIGFNSCWGPEENFAKAIEAKLKEKNT